MAISDSIHAFLFPTPNRSFLVRLILLTLCCYLLFSFLLIPLRIQGHSMEPTYKNGSFALCWRLKYLFSPPGRGDVVTVRFAGKNVMLLKRIAGLPGDTIAFRGGQLYVNKQPLDEPYVTFQSQWDLPERKVKPGYVYVLGDNRGTAMERHKFGQVKIQRIIGGVIP